MKNLIYILSAFALFLSGCEFDNYESPQSMLTGRLVYNNTPVGVRQGITVLQLFQPGWQTYEPIAVNVKQDGTFSALVFDGNYKLVPIANAGPFVASNTDTINVQVGGEPTSVDVPITPYFMVRNESFQANKTSLTATFNIEKVNATATLDKVAVFVGKNLLTDNQFNIAKTEVNGATISNINQTITLTVNTSNANKKHVYVRIGIKPTQNAEYVFSPVQKLEL